MSLNFRPFSERDCDYNFPASSRMRFDSSPRFTLVELMVTITIVGIVIAIALPILFGIGGIGPENIVENALVNRTYVDVSGVGDSRESHYMVATDKGVFEVDNGLLLNMWNSDEVYGKIKEGKTYTFTTKGKKVVNMWWQYYPYIISSKEINTNQLER